MYIYIYIHIHTTCLLESRSNFPNFLLQGEAVKGELTEVREVYATHSSFAALKQAPPWGTPVRAAPLPRVTRVTPPSFASIPCWDGAVTNAF